MRIKKNAPKWAYLFCFLFLMIGCQKKASISDPPQKTPVLGFDHSILAELLANHVNNYGEVDYEAIRKDQSKLKAYLAKIEQANPATFSGDTERIAFWINVYNASVINDVLENVSGHNQSVKAVKGFFDSMKHSVAGSDMTLDEIEKQALRFKEPRVHFALNRASKSSPKIQPFAYLGEQLDFQLNRATREFMSDLGRGLFYDTQKNVVIISPIFKWNAEDFLPSPSTATRGKAEVNGEELFTAVKQFLPYDAKQFFDAKKPAVRFMEYDWSLNIGDPKKKPESSINPAQTPQK